MLKERAIELEFKINRLGKPSRIITVCEFSFRGTCQLQLQEKST
jgi:hypothetical protein